MKGEIRQRWQQLCAQAADEQDPKKLMQLINEINQLLESKEERLLREGQAQEANKQSAA